jgi:hypothetical protein
LGWVFVGLVALVWLLWFGCFGLVAVVELGVGAAHLVGWLVGGEQTRGSFVEEVLLLHPKTHDRFFYSSRLLPVTTQYSNCLTAVAGTLLSIPHSSRK